MRKYLLMPMIFGALSFVRLEAAPMDAYYCFSSTEDAAVVEKMDNFINSDAAKDLPSIKNCSLVTDINIFLVI